MSSFASGGEAASLSDPADVVVVGGGPAGAAVATLLVKKGLSVIVLEKATFPRFRLGESLLPGSLPILDEVGVLSDLKERFIAKYGARFHDDVSGRRDRFSFDGAWRAEHPHAFEVPRDELDKLLLDHARACGAVVREGWNVKRFLRDPAGRVCGVEVLSDEGRAERIDARFVVDATGRDALLAHTTSGTTKIEGLEQTALYAHFEGVPREPGVLEGDIDIVLFSAKDPREPRRANWFWFIPFKDGRTSVGAVVAKSWLSARRAELADGGPDVVSALFERAVGESPTATRLLTNARCLWPKKEAAADFSYRVKTMHAPGVVVLGDAGGFIDPLFSSGAHLAFLSAKLGAETIAQALARPKDEPALLAAWETQVRRAVETFVLAVRTFYAGPLVDLLFAPDKHTALRRSITSLLAGDVFSESIWLRDTRARLEEMLLAATSAPPP